MIAIFFPAANSIQSDLHHLSLLTTKLFQRILNLTHMAVHLRHSKFRIVCSDCLENAVVGGEHFVQKVLFRFKSGLAVR